MSRLFHDLPSNWKLRKLDSITQDIKSGFASGKRDENGIVQLRMNNVDVGGKINLEKTLKVPLPKNIEAYLLQNGDVLFNNTNSVDLIGKTSIFNDEIIPCTYSNHLTRIRGDFTKVDQKWILYNLISLWRKGIFYRICNRHVGQAGITSKDIVNLRIPVPPLVEQNGIVEVLGTVDECIRLTDAVIERAEELKRGLMQQLLTRGIGHTEHEESQFGMIPKKWSIVPLQKITSKIKDMDHKMPNKTEKGVPFISVTYLLKTKSPHFTINYHDKHVEYISESDYSHHKDKFNVEYNDLLYSRFGTIGYARLIKTKKEFLASYSIVMIKPIKTIVEPLFLVYSLNDWDAFKQAKMMTKGSTNKNLHLEDIRNIQIKLPPINEQQNIMKMLLDSDKKIELEENKREILKIIKQGLMQQLLSGKLRVELKEDGLHRIRDGREANY